MLLALLRRLVLRSQLISYLPSVDDFQYSFRLDCATIDHNLICVSISKHSICLQEAMHWALKSMGYWQHICGMPVFAEDLDLRVGHIPLPPCFTWTSIQDNWYLSVHGPGSALVHPASDQAPCFARGLSLMEFHGFESQSMHLCRQICVSQVSFPNMSRNATEPS